MSDHLKTTGSDTPGHNAASETKNASMTPPPLPPTRKHTSEEERQLAVELSKAMAFQPRREKRTTNSERPVITTTDMEATIEPTQLGFQQRHETPPPPLPALPDDDTPDQEPYGDGLGQATSRAGKTATEARWVRAARRSRIRSGFSQAASWIISLGVGGFIITIVAVMLFGVPQSGLPFSWKSAAAVDPPAAASSKAGDRLRRYGE